MRKEPITTLAGSCCDLNEGTAEENKTVGNKWAFWRK